MQGVKQIVNSQKKGAFVVHVRLLQNTGSIKVITAKLELHEDSLLLRLTKLLRKNRSRLTKYLKVLYYLKKKK